ncbi:peptide/nickel transport system substrate-binding protein [Haloactinopolyspora alba]|uniref:Peptide/nickel transport system substrate-binding protein n=1 Tax=Haloactinopolyspora alba TaxID=648780 RepID=A0A2P8DVA9_9ACTN|nr:ABC transporter substrate-binding protein [Haloactinopolyspora alba]PSL01152.1 peptide/nickel transport system substrate-binding protein [Haloactinopolyspora alba]
MATTVIRTRPGKLAVGGAALAMALTGVAAGAPAAQADNEEKTTLTVAVSQEVDSLSPFQAVRVITTSMHRWMYDFLTNYDPQTGETIPALAESWESSDDGLTWTYHIREEATWSDGEPVTAEDVAWTFNTMMTDPDAAEANGNFVENFETVTATDEYTVEIQLSQPQVTMLALDVPILPEHIWSEVDDYGEFNNDQDFPIVSNGPWILTDYQPNQTITFEANEDYWRGAPKFDELVLRTINDADAQVEALRAGEVDFVSGLTPAQFTALEGAENITVNQADGKRFQGMTLNPGAQLQDGTPFGDGHPALQDPVVREALVHTINREQIYEVAYGGFGEPNGGYIPSRYDTFHWEPSGDVVNAFDIDQANQLLEDAGYTMGDDGIRVSPEGRPLSFRFNVHADRPQFVQAAQMMAEWAGQAGIELKVEPVSEVGSLLDAGTYDILTTGWSVNPDPNYVLSINLCSGLPTEIGGAYLSDAYFCNEEYDQLYQQQLAELDRDARADLVHQMQRILYEENVFVVWGYADTLEAYRSDVIAEMTPQPDPGGNYYGQDGYWSWWSAVPAGEAGGGDGGDASAASGGDDGGSNTGVVVGVIVVAVIVLAGVFLLVRRRAATADERE